ncbi:ATP-binding protein [Tateyamaria sp. SN6-1]|uniref:ATP-binding protein n=1 Tax=Tateyamaria sp. SN6-1 TaxID=3092148 RepID=UPI0039F45621
MAGNFSRLFSRVIEGSKTDVSSRLICQFAVDSLKSESAALYLHDRLTAKHRLIASIGPKKYPHELAAINKCQILRSFKGNFMCGALVVDEGVPVHSNEAVDLVKLIVLLAERDFCFEMFKRSGQPVNFQQDETSFYEDLQLLTRESSQMPAGAFRLLEDGRLRTMFFWNDWNDNVFSKGEWDIRDITQVPGVEDCLTGTTPFVLTPEHFEHSFFRQPMQRGVKAAVFCPVIVGNSAIGMLSFAMPEDYEFSSIETSGFLNLANSIGVSVSNFNASAQAGDRLQRDVRDAQMLTAVEVAQAARHSAKADLDTLKTYVSVIRRVNSGATNRQTQDAISEHIAECDAAIGSCFKSLDDIKAAIRPPAKELSNVRMSKLFERAKSQLLGRIIKHRIDVHWEATKESEILCFPDHIVQVFLNLILNSVDAFAEQRKLGNRRAVGRLHDFQENAKTIRIRYEDNAGGINVAKLRQVADDHVTPVEELVFQKDLTTKGKNGSGWGMFVSRRIIEGQGGQLNLLEYRSKTVFEIEIPKKVTV